MLINASLFAHILNDSSLTGTFQLQGNTFSTTVSYLKEYLELLNGTGKDVPAHYKEILHQMTYMVDIEKTMATLNSKDVLQDEINQLSQKIIHDVMHMPCHSKLFIPGGWADGEIGHAIIYQFARHEQGLDFTVINSGDGLLYHAKKSTPDKELYCPAKTWHLPSPINSQEMDNLALFVAHLLNANICQRLIQRKKPMCSEVLYQEVLPLVHLIGGVEADMTRLVPTGAYTAGQLSGTCSQRVIHQLLKINAPSKSEYQRFIFNFKQHALFDYAHRCFSGVEPFHKAVVGQIRLAIDNNLKILNTMTFLSHDEVSVHRAELVALKTKLVNIRFQDIKRDEEQALEYAYTITGGELRGVYHPNNRLVIEKMSTPRIELGDGADLLANIAHAIGVISNTLNKAYAYHLLLDLVVQLPLNLTSISEDGFYRELQKRKKLKAFEELLDGIQTLIGDVQTEWLQDIPSGVINLMILSIASLQMDAYHLLCMKCKRPSFKPFTDAVMASLLKNQQRDAFIATNHPLLDERFEQLQLMYSTLTVISQHSLRRYYKKLLGKDSYLKEELSALYLSEFSTNHSELHIAIRKEGHEALYLLELMHNKSFNLPDYFKSLYTKLNTHLLFEKRIRMALNPLFNTKWNESFHHFVTRDGKLHLNSPLYPCAAIHEPRKDTLSRYKYAMEASFVRDALDCDHTHQSSFDELMVHKTENSIQLERTDSLKKQAHSSRGVTKLDIMARDYYHLRCEPSIQIWLTLDYFTRNVGKLSHEADKRYVEANLFQPGLLLHALRAPQFFPKFDAFLKAGLRFFSSSGQYTRHTLLFVRLNQLVSRYIAIYARHSPLVNTFEILTRLKQNQKELEQQLMHLDDVDVLYGVHQYLFLNCVTQMELVGLDERVFEKAYLSYVYLGQHANPSILEDKAHQVEVESAIARLQLLAQKISSHTIQKIMQHILKPYEQEAGLVFEVMGEYPIYALRSKKQNRHYHLNMLDGKLYEQQLAHSGVPLRIKNHPLIKHLGLDHVTKCLIASDETYMVFAKPNHDVYLYFKNNQLMVQKQWLINQKSICYELQALTKDHLAQKAHDGITPVNASIPKIITDGSMDYWQSANDGLLVKDNKPMYLFRNEMMHVLNEEGNETGFKLQPLVASPIRRFEDATFILNHTHSTHAEIYLPRYHLKFKHINETFIEEDSGDVVLETQSPIHPDVAGLTLMNRNQEMRYLIPVTRFYATEKGALVGAIYPVIHDISGHIAQSTLETYWEQFPPMDRPMWHYEKSEHYVSFQLQNGMPIAKTVAENLYLAYIYLATDQTERAWHTLDECTTRLGGLTGHQDEVQFISWICCDAPHIMRCEQSKQWPKAPQRNTPPYVACRLKALSLLTEHLNQDQRIDLKNPGLGQSANAQYEVYQRGILKNFLNKLPETVYNTFLRYQVIRRHLEHTYVLSAKERKSLLDFYHQSQPQEPYSKGALGYEWMQLSLEFLLQEYHALQGRMASDKGCSLTDKNRLKAIQSHLQQIKPAMAYSTELQLVPLNLTLPKKCSIKNSSLGLEARMSVESWSREFPGMRVSRLRLMTVVDMLSFKIDEDEFVMNFPLYFQVALCVSHLEKYYTSLGTSESLHDPLAITKAKLIDFSTKILMAARHIAFDKQDSNLPLLCNILYRVLNNPRALTHILVQSTTFDALVEQLKTIPVPELKIYEAKNIHKDLLASPNEFMKRDRVVSLPLHIKKTKHASFLLRSGLEKLLTKHHAALKNELDVLFTKYNDLMAQCDAQLNTLAQSLENNLENMFVTDSQAGNVLYVFEQKKRQMARQLIQNPQSVNIILDLIHERLPVLKQEIDKSWKKALTLANQGPKDKDKAQYWRIERQSKARATITIACLRALYARADGVFSIEKTGLSVDGVKQLHGLIHKAFVQGIEANLLERIHKDLSTAARLDDAIRALHALDGLSRMEIPGLDNPSQVILQHDERIVLRKRQLDVLESFLPQTQEGSTFKELVEKVIPGGGKTTLIPLIAEKKALGNNLVVVEVPQSLLATNHVDFNRNSQRLFGKKAYRFEFNRDSKSTALRLEQIYKFLIDIMTSKAYLVTTGETIQSLELKYIEILLSKDPHDEVWKQRLYWCDLIVNLIHHHADCIIDEVHQGLSLKKKLNYTSGDSRPVSTALIKNATTLFAFIDPMFIKNAPDLEDTFDWGPFQKQTACKLIHDSNSPLYPFAMRVCALYGQEMEDALIAYLTNSPLSSTRFLEHASEEEQETLAFFKYELSVGLPQTLTQKLDKDYGASRRPNLSPIEETLAIPYAASNVPNERNRFAHEIKAVNQTIQMMFIKGLSKEQLKLRIKEWQAIARQELFQSEALSHVDETPTAIGFSLLTRDLALKFSELTVENQQQFEVLHRKLQWNSALIIDFLQTFTLKQIQQEGAILSSDHFNHAVQYHSVQGFSGTPSRNEASYHHRLSYDKTTSLGTDAYIIEVIKNKNTPISTCDYEHARQYIHAIMSQSKKPQNTQAIIDIKGTFTGVTHFFVAQELAAYIQKNQTLWSKPIKQVLYFDDMQILCALDVNKPEKSIVLGSSELKFLNRILNTLPDERFTFYDQFHTLGVDITLGKWAHGLVLVDDKTSMQHFLQGAMRERLLDQNQTLELIVPTRLKDMSLGELCALFEKNDKQAIWMDAPFSVKGQMKNIIRRQLLDVIQALPADEAEKKALLMHHYKPFFEEEGMQDVVALYGGINKKRAVEEMLQEDKKALISLWKTCLESAGQKIISQDIATLDNTLEKMIQNAMPFCLPTYPEISDLFASEVEIQREVQHEVDVETLALKETYDKSLKEAPVILWTPINNDALFLGLHQHNAQRLNQLCSQPGQETKLFSNTLYASRNYAQTYIGQKEYLGAFLKPVFLIWYQVHEDTLFAMIVTPGEATQLSVYLREYSNGWIATTQDTVLFGFRHESMLEEKSYHALREQVRFFNGELSSLLNQESPLIWMNENPVEKIEFFEERILPYRLALATELNQLNMILTLGKTKGFDYIMEHPFVDLTRFDWLKEFPDVIAAQAAQYTLVAKVFAYLNLHWKDALPAIEEIQQQFSLPLSSLPYVANHLTHLQSLQRILKYLNRADNQPLLANISDDVRTDIELCIGVALNELAHMNGLNLLKKEYTSLRVEELQLVQSASIDVLNLLHAYPLFKEEKILFGRQLQQHIQQAQSKALLQELLRNQNISYPVIQAILNSPFSDASLVEHVLSMPIEWPEDCLILFTKKCTEDKHIDLMLGKKLTEQIIYHLLMNEGLQVSHLEDLLLKTQSDSNLGFIGVHKAATKAIQWSILNHPLLSADTLMKFDEHQLISEEEVLLVLNRPEAISEVFFYDLAKDPNMGHEILNKILEQTNNPKVLDVVATHKLATLATHQAILRHPLLHASAFLSVMQKPEALDEAMIGELIASSRPMSVDELYVLAQNTVDKKQIDALLARPEMTTGIAATLLKKEKYSFQIKNWPWLSEEQLVLTINTTTDYESLCLAFSHQNLSKKARQKWFQAHSYKENDEQIGMVCDLENKFMLHLEQLKIKSYRYVAKSIEDKQYKRMAKTAFDLYHQLITEFSTHLGTPKSRLTPMWVNCHRALLNAEPVLSTCPVLKQIINDITTVLFGIASLVKKGAVRFFDEKKNTQLQVHTVVTPLSDRNLRV